jgi:2-keto-4-pentenoate hydratase
VHGPAQTHWRDIDLAAHTVRLFVNDDQVREGTGAAVLGNPLHVLAWLANTLPEYGLALKRGDYVTTGVVCDVYAAQQGERLHADFGMLGSVALSFM